MIRIVMDGIDGFVLLSQILFHKLTYDFKCSLGINLSFRKGYNHVIPLPLVRLAKLHLCLPHLLIGTVHLTV